MNRIVLTQIYKQFRSARNSRGSIFGSLRSGLIRPQINYSHDVLNIANLVFKKSEIVGIVGKNGSGKTTLLRIVSSIYPPTKGTIETQGHIVSLIGLRLGLRDRLTVTENIFLFSHLFHNPSPDTTAILCFADLQSYQNSYTYELSQGMLQRLALSIAFHANPDILLLDEVLEGSDEQFRRKAYKKIQAFAKAGATIIFTTHEPEIVSSLATRIITLEKGRIVSDKISK